MPGFSEIEIVVRPARFFQISLEIREPLLEAPVFSLEFADAPRDVDLGELIAADRQLRLQASPLAVGRTSVGFRATDP